MKTYLYLLPFTDGQHFKIGISSKNASRIISHNSSFGVCVQNSLIITANRSSSIKAIETILKNTFPQTDSSEYYGKDGYTEIRKMCYWEECLNEVNRFSDSLGLQIKKVEEVFKGQFDKDEQKNKKTIDKTVDSLHISEIANVVYNVSKIRKVIFKVESQETSSGDVWFKIYVKGKISINGFSVKIHLKRKTYILGAVDISFNESKNESIIEFYRGCKGKEFKTWSRALHLLDEYIFSNFNIIRVPYYPPVFNYKEIARISTIFKASRILKSSKFSDEKYYFLIEGHVSEDFSCNPFRAFFTSNNGFHNFGSKSLTYTTLEDKKTGRERKYTKVEFDTDLRRMDELQNKNLKGLWLALIQRVRAIHNKFKDKLLSDELEELLHKKNI